MSDTGRPILLTGGGTGGHVYPALAVSQAVRAVEPGARFVYVGVPGGIEQAIARQNRIPFLGIRTAPYPGLRSPIGFLRFGLLVALGTLQAIFHLLRVRPRTLVATGGYVAAPAVFAAVLLRGLRLLSVRIFVHEQNASPGRLNRLVARFADIVGVSFHETLRTLPGAPTRYVGYPVRPSLRASLAAESEEAPDVLRDVPSGRRIVLAFGGSQGARTVNRAVVDALPHLAAIDDVFVIHGVGRRQRGGYDPEADVASRLEGLSLERPVADFYRRVPYIDDIGSVYRACSLVICRGGAGTVKEICAVGRPAILLPKAGLAGDHQVLNALVLDQAGAGLVLLEEPTVGPEGLLPAVRGDRLAACITELLGDSARTERMGAAALELDDPDAMERIIAAMGGDACEGDEPVSSTETQRIEIRLAERGPAQLLSYVRGWCSANPQAPRSEIPGHAYLEYRAASMLTASAWRVRNVGVKIVGLLRLSALVPLLRHLFEDPRPASRLARLVGGDRVQNGFIRRNICTSLTQAGLVDDDVEAILRAGVSDSYWEVRREACRGLRILGASLSSRDWAQAAVERLLGDRSFEVRAAAIRTVGVSRDLDGGLPLLRPFYMDANWQLREAVLRCFEAWATAGSDDDRARLRCELDRVLLTAGGYRPLFGLKDTARRAGTAVQNGAQGGAAT